MTAALILWGHALAALLFAATALAEWRRGRAGRGAFVAALLATALWALAVAGIDARDLAARLAEAVRNLAWLGFAFTLVRRTRVAGWALAAVYAVVALVMVTGAGLAAAEAVTHGDAAAALATARLVFGMMAAAGALVLVRQLHAAALAGRSGVRPVARALALIWAADLVLSAAAYADTGWGTALVAARGLAVAAAGLLLAVTAHRRDDWTLALSRAATMRALGAIALVLYLGAVSGLARLAGALGGDYARALQAGVVIGAATALATFASTTWLGAWAKVKLAKHLFRHRYDYRVEWQRFTDTLAGDGAALEERVVEALAKLLDAPAGLLLTADAAGEAWRWEPAPAPLDPPLAERLRFTRRIVELDAVRAGRAPEDAAVVPGWMLARADAWALAPLVHGDTLAGAVLLARPLVDRALDWEDFDLLRIAGRQVASYLAEARAADALAEARRFDEFNRRFAFILHDIKNLVSQQQLVARNAERHAANAEFRADMVATLKDSADRMTSLLARLSSRETGTTEPLAPVDCAALVERIAHGRRAQHPIMVEAESGWATARPQRLEQALGHLVQNAIEASAAAVPVTLRVRAADGRVTVDVVDRGPGMSAACIRDQLFRPFASSKPGGFGIGAFEARQLVGAMGGTLAVESREGEGTRFRITLPAAAALEVAA
ncbi:XrtA/PEP-CTERM system histidine kinase PrsK [uncultured Sphingomonas sp.]|uniref:XrtA/PEP-CTERM system histidine kinase PrsK n=1 Tax=uncultured Sphingomonas sp. TaxID=158754 RepID=UPI0035CB3457